MLPIVITVAFFILIIPYNFIMSIKGRRNDIINFGDILLIGALVLLASGVITLIGSLIVTKTAAQYVVTDNYYELTPIADGVYGYTDRKGTDRDSVYYLDDKGNIKMIEYGSYTNVIYTDKYKPYYSETLTDTEDEMLRYLFWNMESTEITVCVPPGSIVEEPDIK